MNFLVENLAYLLASGFPKMYAKVTGLYNVDLVFLDYMVRKGYV